MFLEPLREPGTKLACEFHGGKAGRFWGFEKVVLEDITLFRPRMCPHCKQEEVIFDELDFPYCPSCGTEPFKVRPKRRSRPEIERYRRLKEQKRSRIIYK
jgi:Zn finger protein HypA/HybF involved in hydrogenase expression